jgi:hypothetical protein
VKQTKQDRIKIANELIEVIAAHGRRFFHCDGRVSRLELDHRGRIWFVDSWEGARVYTHSTGRWRKFHNGGTLRRLIEALRDFVMGRDRFPLVHLGPWPGYICDGDPWGYGDEMTAVREKAKAIASKVREMP